MKAMVMAAGVGTRLRPLTFYISKPMVPILDAPVLEYSLRLLKKHGIKDVMLNLHYMPEDIVNYFGAGENLGMNVKYSREEKLMGTAGGVKKVEDFFDGTFVVMSGDGLSAVDLSAAIDFHKKKKALATIVLKEVSSPLEYGVVITDSEGRITRFLEKPSWNEVFSNKANTGIYIFEKEIFNQIPAGTEYDFGSQLFPLLLEKGLPLYAIETEKYWCDIGDLPEYLEAHKAVFNLEVSQTLPGKIIKPGVWVNGPSKIDRTAEITGPAYIGRNVTIGRYVKIGRYVSIGDNTVVQEGAELDRCVIWKDSDIGKDAELTGCIIGKGNVVGKNARIFDGAVSGDNCRIGSNTVIHPSIKIWPDKSIEEGASVNSCVIWSDNIKKNLFAGASVQGLLNYEINPEFVSRLAVSFGTAVPEKSSVFIASENSRQLLSLKGVFANSLTATGVNVLDGGACPEYLARFASAEAKASGGIYIRENPADKNSVIIDFYDEKGLDLLRKKRKAAEKAFFTEEIRRVPPEKMGNIEKVNIFTEKYLERVINILAQDGGSSLKNKWGFFYCGGSEVSAGILQVLVERFAGQSAFYRRNPGESVPQFTGRSAKLTRELDLFGGLFLDDSSGRYSIITEGGLVLDGRNMISLVYSGVIKYNNGLNIGMPIDMPYFLEGLLKKNAPGYKKLKTDESSIMESALNYDISFTGTLSGKTLYTVAFPYFDLITGAFITAALSEKANQSISGQVAALESTHVSYAEKPCPWELKGAVMLELVKTLPPERTELVDGVRLEDGRGWVLIIPDLLLPVFHIYSDYADESEAAEKVRHYSGYLEEIIKNKLNN